MSKKASRRREEEANGLEWDSDRASPCPNEERTNGDTTPHACYASGNRGILREAKSVHKKKSHLGRGGGAIMLKFWGGVGTKAGKSSHP